MNRILLSLVIGFSFPTLICKAEMTAFNPAPVPIQHPDVSEIRYGFSHLRFNDGALPDLKIYRPEEGTEISFGLMKTAEASGTSKEFTFQDFERIYNAVNDAGRLEDLKLVLTENNFQLLKAKVESGVSQYVVLTNLQAMRPRNFYIIDSNVKEERAVLLVGGQSYFGPMQGLVHLVRIESVWKIENEEWYAGGKNDKDPVAAAYYTYKDVRTDGLLARVSPDYRIRNLLSLTPVPYTKARKAFTFVFLMGKKSVETAALDDAARKKMHILWTGSKRLMPKQMQFKNEYPVDVSIANYDDGYAPGQLNLILPDKKPRGVMVSWLWSF